MNATRETDIVEVDSGKEYTVSALGLMELESLETYIQGRIINAGRTSIPDDATPEVEERMMQPVIAYAMNTSITDDNGFKQLMNFGGIIRLIYYSLKREHPDITLEKCREFVVSGEQLKFLSPIGRINKLQYVSKDKDTPNQKHPKGPENRPVPDSAGPNRIVRDATERDSGVVSESASRVSESNGAG